MALECEIFPRVDRNLSARRFKQVSSSSDLQADLGDLARCRGPWYRSVAFSRPGRVDAEAYWSHLRI